MPSGVVEIDDVDGGHAGLQEGQVVVFDRHRFADEAGLVAKAAGDVPDDVGQPRRGVGFAPDVQVAIADHVEQDQRAQ